MSVQLAEALDVEAVDRDDAAAVVSKDLVGGRACAAVDADDSVARFAEDGRIFGAAIGGGTPGPAADAALERASSPPAASLPPPSADAP